MLVGGISGLLLQMLHPGALAGVWDHSDFRRDMQGRLRRTAQFISRTTYGSTRDADAMIAHVRSIHDRVSGVMPDGRPYSANDPDLLAWVHVAGASSFLESHVRYGAALTSAERDRYFAETAVIAGKLGATDVPTGAGAVEQYFAQIRPALRADERTRTVARALLTHPTPSLALAPFSVVVLNAAIALLPPWAARMHGFHRRSAPRAGDAAVRAVRKLTNWALAS